MSAKAWVFVLAGMVAGSLLMAEPLAQVFTGSGGSSTFTGEVTNTGTFAVQVDNLDAAEDQASANLDPGIIPLCRRTASPANTSSNDGDLEYIQCSAGRMWVSAYVENAATDEQEDQAHSDGDTGPAIMSRRIDVAATSAGASGDYSTVNTDASGLLWSRQLDPCSGVSKSFIPIDITTATTTELTSALAGSGNHYYICAFNIVTTAASNVSLVDDDSDNCGSVTSGIIGGLTAGEGWNFAANGGIAIGNGAGSVMRTNGTNRVICLVSSASTELHGHMVVVAAPAF